MDIIAVISFVFIFTPLLTGAVSVLIFGKKRSCGRTGVPALVIHSVPSHSLTGVSHIKADVFKDFLTVLKNRNYKTCRAADLETLYSPNRETDRPSVIITFDDGFEDFYTNALPCLKELNMTATVFVIAGYIDKHSSWDVYKKRKHLNKIQIRKISEAGIEIGSHTMYHPDLTALSAKELYSELQLSKNLLENITGCPVTSVSFPFGKWNTEVWKKAQECGYRTGSIYGGRAELGFPLLSASGVYSFDTIDDIIEKVDNNSIFSNSIARSRIMPHFAKGTFIWKYGGNYSLIKKNSR